MNDKQQQKANKVKFLKELSALSVKHGISIAGCGCCGSPYLSDTTAKAGHYTVSDSGDDLSFNEVPA